MIDFGFDKLALIGAVALIVIGPEKLPRVARTVGHFLGKAQRYVADVKAEVNRSIELEELQKMKRDFESGARDVEQTLKADFDEASKSIDELWKPSDGGAASTRIVDHDAAPAIYTAPRKRWRVKRGALPQWYKRQAGVKRHVQSGAARVARHRPAGQR